LKTLKKNLHVYSKDYVGLSRSYKGKVITHDFENSKTLQTENIQRQLRSLQGEEILVFTDGSTLGNLNTSDSAIHHTISLMYVGARHLEFGTTSYIVT